MIDRLTEVKKAAHETYGSANQRFLIWLSAWGWSQEHPLIGKGWGCFELFYPFYQGPLLLEKGFELRTHANNCHNEVLEYWSQIGMIGLGIVFWMWILFFRLGAIDLTPSGGSIESASVGIFGRDRRHARWTIS